MLQIKARLESPTRAQVLEELEALGWEYNINVTPTGRIQYHFKPNVERHWWQKRQKQQDKLLLPNVWLGEFTITVILDPVFNFTITLPLDKITIYKSNPYQLVIMGEDSEVFGVFGKHGWVKEEDFRHLTLGED